VKLKYTNLSMVKYSAFNARLGCPEYPRMRRKKKVMRGKRKKVSDAG
jgi:hypothetical protein